jgi:chemotaxis regulatin CheY-phosphate phosphatase CheZ
MDSKALEDLTEKFTKFETFVRRRFDEISMEINATSQQLDLSSQDIIGQFGEVMGVLSAVTHTGDGKSQVNAGYELEAVIADTENAAINIMDAADRITNRLRDQTGMDTEDARRKVFDDIKSEVQNILMACTFQDLTSQRIRKALDNINTIQDRLGTTLEKLGIKPDNDAGAAMIEEANKTRVHSQSDIDAMFN